MSLLPNQLSVTAVGVLLFRTWYYVICESRSGFVFIGGGGGRGLETTDAFLKFVFVDSSCVVYFIVTI